MSKMIRISEDVSNQLDALASETSLSKQRLLQDAVELLSRELFLKKTNAEYSKLKKDGLLDALDDELMEWDFTLSDVLSDE